jgi:hypothetical protein
MEPLALWIGRVRSDNNSPQKVSPLVVPCMCGPVVKLLPTLHDSSSSRDNGDGDDNGEESSNKKKAWTTPRFAKEIQELQRLQMETEGINVELTTTTTNISKEKSLNADPEETAKEETTPMTPTISEEEDVAAVVATGDQKTNLASQEKRD